MALAVSRLPLTAEDRVRARISPYEIYGAQSGTEIGFLRVLLYFTVNIITP
jgi:hypothetical protein